MSADNYLYVGKTRTGEYAAEMRFASCEYPRRIKKSTPWARTFGSAAEAVAWAHAEVHREYYEYGVSVDREVADELARLAGGERASQEAS